jgi:hypothetical protein
MLAVYLPFTDSVALVRWDPNREDLIFFEQSAHLYAAFYQLQISVHRPFIANQREAGGAVVFVGEGCPSLAICTHAARACSKVAHTYASRMGLIAFNLVVSVFCTWDDMLNVEDIASQRRRRLGWYSFLARGAAAARVRWASLRRKWTMSTSAWRS